MSYDIRKPQISAPTELGQILQIKSYLIQLVDQLGFALNDLAKGSAAAPAETAASTERAVSDPDLESRFVAFQSQVIGGSVADTVTLGKRLAGTAAAETDLDVLRTPGCYYSSDGAYIKNSPSAGGFRLEVKQIEDGEKILQTAYYGAARAARYFDGSGWSVWVQFESTAAPADFVTERGQQDGWTYRKWKGGTYEMYGTFEVTPALSEAIGTLYRTDGIEVPTPFAITDDAVVTGMGTDNYLLTDGVYANDSAISIRIMSGGEIGTADTITVRLHVTGTYAQTED